MSTININLSANTIYSGDGTLAGNRTVDANGYQLQISNAGVFIVDSSFAPSGGNGTFTLNGYGTSGSDLVEKISSDSGVIRESYGDKNQRFYGYVNFNSFNTARIGKNPNAQGIIIEAPASDGTYKAGWAFGSNGGEFVGQGDFGGGTAIQIINSTADYAFSTLQNGAGTSIWLNGMINSDYLVRGYIPSLLQYKTILKANKSNAVLEFPFGVTKHNGLTTAEKNALTPEVGMVVFDSTLGRYERYDATFGWVTMAQRTIHVECNTIATLSTGSNFYFANFPLTASTTRANREFLSPYTGKITGAFIRSFANSVAGNRGISVYLVIDGTDYLVATVTGSTSTANREFINEAINTTGVSVIKNVTKIAMKVVATGGTTDSTNILFGGTLIVQ